MEFSEVTFSSNLGKNVYPLTISEVFYFMQKRKFLLEDFNQNENTIIESKNVIFEKTYEYTIRFSKRGKYRPSFVRAILSNFKNNIEIIKKGMFKVRINLCKIIDLLPKSIEEACILIPKLTEVFRPKDIKIIINQLY